MVLSYVEVCVEKAYFLTMCCITYSVQTSSQSFALRNYDLQNIIIHLFKVKKCLFELEISMIRSVSGKNDG